VGPGEQQQAGDGVTQGLDGQHRSVGEVSGDGDAAADERHSDGTGHGGESFHDLMLDQSMVRFEDQSDGCQEDQFPARTFFSCAPRTLRPRG
jgi:hypothetical protein